MHSGADDMVLFIILWSPKAGLCSRCDAVFEGPTVHALAGPVVGSGSDAVDARRSCTFFAGLLNVEICNTCPIAVMKR